MEKVRHDYLPEKKLIIWFATVGLNIYQINLSSTFTAFLSFTYCFLKSKHVNACNIFLYRERNIYIE